MRVFAPTGLLCCLAACGTPPPAAATRSPPPIVLIMVDTLRADRVGALGSDRGLTPNIDRFAGEGVVFAQTYAQANETLFSHASLFSGRFASELGPVDHGFVLPADTPTMASVLGLYGYETGGFVGGAQLDPAFGLDAGFAEYQSAGSFASLWNTIPLAQAWLDGLGADQTPFLFLHGYDPHNRYLKPAPWGYSVSDLNYKGVGGRAAMPVWGSLMVRDGAYLSDGRPDQLFDYAALRLRSRAQRKTDRARTEALGVRHQRFTEKDRAHLAGVYDGAVAYADAQVGVALAMLEERALLDQSVVVITSDHGESLGEDGLFHHRYGLSDRDLHVPLIVRLPGGEGGGQVVHEGTELVDLMPTLLDLAGASHPTGLAGRSLLPVFRGEAIAELAVARSEGAFRMVSVRSAQGRLVFTGLGPNSPYLSGMAAHAQLPGPAFAATPGALPLPAQEQLRAALVAWRGGLTVSLEAASMTQEQRDLLRSHGYWEPQ